MNKRNASLLFLAKADDENCDKALELCQSGFARVTAHLGRWGDPLPPDLSAWEGQYIISYLSRWILPDELLRTAKIAAINFHPGSPEYPGYGCYNFALYEGAKQYGTTCHHMGRWVDTGPIVAVRRFDVLPTDDVASLVHKTHEHQFELFSQIARLIIEGRELPTSDDRWKRKPFTKKQLNELAKITPDMSEKEIAKRIRATNFGAWKPIVELRGFTFELKT